LVANVNGGENFYIHDRWSRQTSLISVDLSGKASGSSSPTNTSISADGRYVAFEDYGNLVKEDTNFLPDVYVRDRKLITTNPTDLQITATQKPSTLVRNSQGSYTYTITNNGPDPAYTTITHLVSNGEVVGFTPAKGKCNSYASISICNLDLLQPGASVTLDISVKALRTPVSQQLTLASGGRDDPNKTNNYLTVNTPVTP
jgi:archaellum component FlaF (FlaF/FlaG flagellin family)